MTNGTVLVASPSAIGRQPEASGSSVPAWPARLALNRRLITDTAWVEVMPTGLSSTTQPCTSCFSRFCWRGFGGWMGGCSFMIAIRETGGEIERSSRTALLVIRLVALEVALHPRRMQQLLDARGLVEPLVDAEADVGRELHVHPMGDLAAQEPLVALERIEHRLLVLAAERHHVDGGELEVGAHAHLGHGDHVLLDHRVVHLAARQDVGDGVA